MSRSLIGQKLTLDGGDIDGTLTTVYIRGNQASDNTNEGAVSLGTIIETTSTNQVLNVEVNRTDGTNALTINLDDTGATVLRTAITIAKLRDSDADYIRLDDSGAVDMNPVSLTSMGWDTEDEIDVNAFTHPATSSPDSTVAVDIAGDYLFLTTHYAAGAGVTRAVYNQGWSKNGGALIEYGQTGNCNRNSGANDIGNWSGIIFDSLALGDHIEVETQAVGATGVIIDDIKGLQGVRIDSLKDRANTDSPADGASIADSVVAALGFPRTEVAGLAETVGLVIGAAPAERPTIVDSAVSALGFTRTDLIGLGESVTPNFPRQDAATLTDSFATGLGLRRSETFSALDAAVAALGFSRADASAFVDSVLLGFSRADILGVDDLLTLGFPRGDSATAADAMVAAMGFSRQDAAAVFERILLGFTRSEGPNLAELATLAFGLARSDRPLLAEVVGSALGFGRSDAAAVVESALLGFNRADALGADDSVLLGFPREDRAGIADSAAAAFGFGRTDAGTLAESVAVIGGTLASDRLALAESGGVVLGFLRRDSSNLADSALAALGFSRSDVLGMQETAAFVLGFQRQESQAIADAAIAALGFTRSDSSNLREAVEAVMAAVRLDGAGTSASVVSALGFPRADRPGMVEAATAALGFGRTDVGTLSEFCRGYSSKAALGWTWTGRHRRVHSRFPTPGLPFPGLVFPVGSRLLARGHIRSDRNHGPGCGSLRSGQRTTG